MSFTSGECKERLEASPRALLERQYGSVWIKRIAHV
jgi:hypothetical protein